MELLAAMRPVRNWIKIFSDGVVVAEKAFIEQTGDPGGPWGKNYPDEERLHFSGSA